MNTFRNRTDAGIQLVQQLEHLRETGPVVLALPRGGVVVGYEVAMGLDAPLDVLVCRKLGAPGHEEFGFGAVGPGGATYLDQDTVAKLGLLPSRIEAIAAGELAEARRTEELYGVGRGRPQVQGRTVILVDDGMATGATALAAILWAARQNPLHLVLAVPVAPSDTLHSVAANLDELVCLKIPRDFRAVGQWYEDFSQVSDEEVVRLLRLARRNEAPAGVRLSTRSGGTQEFGDVKTSASPGGGPAGAKSGLLSCDKKEEVTKHDPHNH